MEIAPTGTSTSFETFADEDLLKLLRTEEDRLPRAAVDEFVRRGERMIEPLARICRDERGWKGSFKSFWPPIHATLILGAIGGEKALDGLLAALRGCVEHDVDWVQTKIAGILGAIGRPAIGPLKIRAREEDLDPHESALAVSALAAVAARHPIEQGEILEFLSTVADDREVDHEIRGAGAMALLAFARPGDRPRLLNWAAYEHSLGGIPLFDRREVLEAYRRGTPDLRDYLRDWLDFYDPAEIEKRRARCRDEREDGRWAEGVRDHEDWVRKETEAILERYGRTLGGLDEDARSETLFVAKSMIEYLPWNQDLAPWRWTALMAEGYLLHYFPRMVGMDDPRDYERVPDHFLRYVRFWESEGRIDEKGRSEIESFVQENRRKIVRALRDPSLWDPAKTRMARMVADGVDVLDDAAVRRWTEKQNAPSASPGVGRNAPCPCGSGKKFKRCCGK